MKLLNLVAALMLVAVPAQAQFNPSPNDPQAPVEMDHYRGDLRDFTKVEFLCYASDADYITTAICTAAENEANAQAREHRLAFTKATGGHSDDKAFTLYVHITSAGAAPRGMAVRVEASRYYVEAVDQRAGHRDPAAFARSGKLVFFEETTTGVGRGDNLELQLRQRVQGIVQKLFANNFN